MGLISLLFGFSGRINRVQYWLGSTMGGVAGALLMFLLGVLTLPDGDIAKSGASGLRTAFALGLTFGLPLTLMAWIGYALQGKRFHDRGRSALWAMAPMLPAAMIAVNIVAGAASGASLNQVNSSTGMWMFLLWGVNLFMFVDLGCMPGQVGPNKYGDPPGGGFRFGNPHDAHTQPSQASPKPAVVATLRGAECAIDRAIAANAAGVPLAAPARRAGAAAAHPAPLGFGRKPAH